jgi:hypothetical protein
MFLLGCGHFGIIKGKQPQATAKQRLVARYEANKAKLIGWPSRTDCDATLWAGLAKAGGVDLDLTEAKDKEGKFYRNPNHDCFDHKRSRSDFSGDMLMGLVLALDRHNLRLYHAWLKVRRYRTGRGDPITSIIKPNIMGVMSRRTKLEYYPRFPYAANKKDYVRHIQMLMIYVDGRTTGHITEHELKHLQSYDDGKDYLLSAIIARYTGKYDKTINLLLAEGSPPTYVRGDEPERYRLAHWLFSAKIILGD